MMMSVFVRVLGCSHFRGPFQPSRTYRLSLLSFIFLSLFSLSIETFAAVELNMFDFDGTLMENRQSKAGSFNAKFIIYRINQRLNLLQTQATGPAEIEITQQEYKRMEAHLGQGEARPGLIGLEVTLENKMKVNPADYYMRYPDSLKYFREAESAKTNHLLDAFKAAEKKPVGIEWRGPLWEKFVELCSTPEGAETIGIITARGHSEAEWTEFYDYLQKRGHIKFRPSAERVYNVTRPEFDRHSNHGGAHGDDPVNIAERKAMILEEILTDLRRVDPEGGKHTVMFADDSQENLDRAAQVFRKFAFGNYSPVRMILVNAGLVKDVRASDRPEVSYIEPGSKTFVSIPREKYVREPSPKQNAIPRETSSAKSKKLTTLGIVSCESLFTGAVR